MRQRHLLSGNEAIALAAKESGVSLGTGYPGTPSTEILEELSRLGGSAQWAPNEKVALELGIGVSFAGCRALVTMKHVGLNVAADPFFAVAYTGVIGGLVVVSADDPGMASSQNEQDNRRYAVAAGVPMIEPADAQEAYLFTKRGFEISEQWKLPVLIRTTTRVSHSYAVVVSEGSIYRPPVPQFQRDIQSRVMIPANARLAHRRLRAKLDQIQQWLETEQSQMWLWIRGSQQLGLITSGVSYLHVREAYPEASVLKLHMTYPLPFNLIRQFRATVERCVVVEEGDPYLVEQIRAAEIPVEGKPEAYRFGELDVDRVRALVEGRPEDGEKTTSARMPRLCDGCPYRLVFEDLRDLGCIVTGDIGCYTLGALPPFEAMDTCLCMGSSIGIGLGLRHVLPPQQAKKVVSVLGDSTFFHSGLPGLVEMVYNPPPTGHVVLVLDNCTTAMTGHQEHPGTGRRLNGEPTKRVSIEQVSRAIGLDEVYTVEPRAGSDEFRKLLQASLDSGKLVLIVARRPCLLAARKRKILQTKDMPPFS